MTSASEAKKPARKQATKHATCQVQTDKLWSTLQAQLLAKISDALKPKKIDFANYDALFHIPRVLSKPGMVLAGDTDYQILPPTGRGVDVKRSVGSRAGELK